MTPGHPCWVCTEQRRGRGPARSPGSLWRPVVYRVLSHCPAVACAARSLCNPRQRPVEKGARVWAAQTFRGPWDTLPALATCGTSSTHHDSLVAHVELGLSRDQGLLVLPDGQRDPAQGTQVLGAGKARGERTRSLMERGPGWPAEQATQAAGEGAWGARGPLPQWSHQLVAPTSVPLCPRAGMHLSKCPTDEAAGTAAMTPVSVWGLSPGQHHQGHQQDHRQPRTHLGPSHFPSPSDPDLCGRSRGPARLPMVSGSAAVALPGRPEPQAPHSILQAALTAHTAGKLFREASRPCQVFPLLWPNALRRTGLS